MKIQFNLTKKKRTFKKHIYGKNNVLIRVDDITISNKNINSIFNLIANKMLYSGVDNGGYVDIHSSHILNISKGTETMEYLLLDGLVERNYYIANKKSFGYRFSESVKETLEIESMILDVNDKLYKNKSNERLDFNFNETILKRLKKDFNSIIIDNFNVDKEYSGKFIDYTKYISNFKKLKSIEDGNKYFKTKNARLYTNFTQLSSKVRTNNIRLSGEELVEFDISNSFPLILALYCLKINPEIINDYEFQEYSRLVLEGKFYGKLVMDLNNVRNQNKSGEYDSDGEKVVGDRSVRNMSKKEAKLAFQYFLNGEKDDAYIGGLSISINKYINQMYNPIYKIVKNIKEDGEKMYDKLVKIETQYIFMIISKLYNTYDDIKILTCHDAIYVPKSFEKDVEVVWNNWMDKITQKLPEQREYKKLDYTFNGELFI